MCTALVVGNMIGSGIFLLPTSLASYGGISLIGWLFTATGAVFLALTFAHLSRLVPKAGGPYAYARVGFGDLAGFLVAWGYWIAVWVGNAAIVVALVGYLAVFFPALADGGVVAGVTSVAFIWLLTAVNIAGVRAAGTVQLVTTVLKILPLMAIGIFGLTQFNAGHFEPFNLSSESTFSAVNSTAALTLWALLGLESATIPAGHVRDPARTIPRATIVGTLAAALIYILATVAIMGTVAPAALAASTAPFADAAAFLWGPTARLVMAGAAVVACLGALNGWILMQGQIPQAAADDRLFPSRFGRCGANGTPVFGLVVSSALCTVLVVLKHTGGLVKMYTFAIQLAVLTTLAPYLLSAAAGVLFIFAKRTEGCARRLWGASVLAVLAFAYSAWAVAGLDREVVLLGVLLLIGGVPVYLWLKWGVRAEARNTKETQ